MSTVTLTINERHVTAPAGSTILEAARGAGISIPTLCHLPTLQCRICVVEVEGRQLTPACISDSEGMKVRTHRPRWKHAAPLWSCCLRITRKSV
jgi:NADH dehydrogenase/NADH:ubiquinone oxidoreductase subunit G